MLTVAVYFHIGNIWKPVIKWIYHPGSLYTFQRFIFGLARPPHYIYKVIMFQPFSTVLFSWTFPFKEGLYYIYCFSLVSTWFHHPGILKKSFRNFTTGNDFIICCLVKRMTLGDFQITTFSFYTNSDFQPWQQIIIYCKFSL